MEFNEVDGCLKLVWAFLNKQEGRYLHQGIGESACARPYILLSLQRPDKTNPFKELLPLPDLCCSRVTEPSEWVGYEDWR